MFQMKEMQLKEGAAVTTPEGKQVGKVDAFVVDPETREVTHLVVRRGWLRKEDKVVPMRMLRSADEGRVVLSEAHADLDQFPPFEAAHYVSTEGEIKPAASEVRAIQTAYYWYPPVGSPGYPAYGLDPYAWPPMKTERNIPQFTVPVKEGTHVFASDGQEVGHVERLFVQPDSDVVSHVLISHGLLAERRLLPIGWVRSIQEDRMQLNVPTGVVKGVRPYGANE